MKKTALFPIVAFFLFSCAPAVLVPTRRSPAVSMATESRSVPVAAPISDRAKALFYLVHGEGDAEKIIGVLSEFPDFHPTLIFPPGYFLNEANAAQADALRVFQSSGQIDIALTLENSPNLPMLANLSVAGNAAAWDIDYRWAEDVGGQVARGSGEYQKRWAKLPSGFVPPYMAVTDDVLKILERFRFNWVLIQPADESGVLYSGPTPILVPGRATSADEVLSSTHTLVFVDSSIWEDPKEEVLFLRAVAEKQTPWLIARSWSERIERVDLLPEGAIVGTKDFSQWTLSDKQRLAWRALADARKVVDTYQNSGRANLKRLDAAMEEMYRAQAGDFLLALGQQRFVSTLSERSFLATLANVYRLSGVAIPSGLNVWFTNSRWKKSSPVRNAQSDQPFMVDGDDFLLWNDPKEDDKGAGSIVYPLGKYPAGAFDLQSLRLQWTDASVQFVVGLGGLASENNNNVLPLIDIYIDVNRLSGAGSSDVLKGRRGAVLQKDAAWEYALALTPTGGVLYQGIPGQAPRVLQAIGVRLNPSENQLTASLSKILLRGNPKQWRLTVGVMGTTAQKVGGDFLPVGVQVSPSDRNFGGASVMNASSFLDLLVPTVEEQQSILSGSAGRSILPSVEAQ